MRYANPFFDALTGTSRPGAAVGTLEPTRGGGQPDPGAYMGMFNALARELGAFRPYTGQWTSIGAVGQGMGVAPPRQAMVDFYNSQPLAESRTPSEPNLPFWFNPYNPTQHIPAPVPSFTPPKPQAAAQEERPWSYGWK